MLQALKLAEPGVFAPARRPAPTDRRARSGRAQVAAGPFQLGAGDEGFAYDNERPRHDVDVDAFRIDRAPVTNAQFRDFIADGGYERAELWSPEGWALREQEGWERPLYWTADGRERRFERIEPIDPAMPVMHVSWYEADAYARWAGKRLPTEEEWEKAASWDPETETKRLYPWGDEVPTQERANLDQLAFSAAEVGAYPGGASAYGVLGMIGDVWEWTASDFHAYPGFEAFPYREYSEVFFGPDYKVLRGGSWATRPAAIRNTFRNWDFPIRRQLFCGFRCARDS
jgi:iron(II)-dependent oxidoreductase